MHYKINLYAFFEWSMVLVIVLCINGLFAFKNAGNSLLHYDTTEPIFIDVVSSKSTVFVGETLTVQYLLYFSTNIVDPQDDLDIKIKDCYMETYPDEPVADKLINGKSYHVRQLKKVLLIPQLVGAINIPAISIQLKINRPPSKDNFFGTEEQVVRGFSSQVKQVKVLALPYTASSVPFTGAVGRFKLNYKFTPSKKIANSLNVKIGINGYGDLKFARWPPPALPSGIDIFNINNNETDNLVVRNIKTRHTFSFDLVSNFRGDFNIPKIAFLYFDPDSAKYVKYETPAYKWQVDIGPKPPESLVEKKAPVKMAPFLYTKMTMHKEAENQLFFASKAHILLIIFGLILFVTGGITIYKTKIKEDNPALYNLKNAKKQAVNKIRKLKIKAHELDENLFYKNLDEILQTYICYKTRIALREFSVEYISKRLLDTEVPADVRAIVELFIKQQYTKRFSPCTANNYKRESDCSRLLQIVKSLDIYLK